MRECVLTPAANPLQALDLENFTTCRTYRYEAVGAAYRRGGLDALCDAIEQHMDHPSCSYGNCGEAAHVFAGARRAESAFPTTTFRFGKRPTTTSS